jgi:hypothetical protein
MSKSVKFRHFRRKGFRLVRERGAADCSGVCFKWQQIFNNSGIFSYATIRGCLPEMLNIDKVNLPLANATSAPHSECNSSGVFIPLLLFLGFISIYYIK